MRKIPELEVQRMTMPDGSEVEFTLGSGNVFADLGLPNPEERLLKAELAVHIGDLVKAQGLTQSQVAARTGLPQSNISNILRGRLSGYSVERLLQVVNRLGRSVEVRIAAHDSAPETARTVVKIA